MKSLKNYLLLASLGLLFACTEQTNVAEEEEQETTFTYPKTTKSEQVDDYFGTQVADPYRWLEDDKSEETAQWVKSQNEFTFAHLNKISFRDKLKKRLEEVWNYEKVSAPFRRGDNYLFYKNDGLQNQSILYIQKDLDSEPEILLDPNKLSDDGTVALSGISFSKDAKYMAYQVSRSGSDWREVYVMEVESRKKLDDKVEWVKFSGTSWERDGFYYSRYDEPKGEDEFKGANKFQKVYYHSIGTPQSEDYLVYKDDEHPERGFGVSVTEDERFLILSAWESTSGNTLAIKDLRKKEGKFVSIIDNFDSEQYVIDNEGGRFLVQTSLDAPNQRLVEFNIENPAVENWKDLIPETKEVLSAGTAGGQIFANYMKDARSVVKQFDMQGKLVKEIELPGIGSANGFGGNKDDKVVFYTFSSFINPPSVYKYDIEAGESSLLRQPDVKFNPDDFETKQVFFNSKDGTKIPMFITYKKGLELNGKNPTMLYSYGGFNISLPPRFKIANIVWMENGGIYAQPNIRGGGEYGEEWHKAGTKMQKQNVFDDFIAAAEYLVKEKYTSSEYLAISGRSNGGLLVGATMTQRPDLFKVAFPGVGVLDMLRYQYFTIGRAWSVDYGTSEDSKEMFDYLYKYSPVHNAKETEYPATLITTADHDDRVVPAHSFKFAASLQEKAKGKNPVMIRIESKAGHGSGKPTSKQIEEQVDMFAFALHHMGLEWGADYKFGTE